jgi:hypothetical protein
MNFTGGSQAMMSGRGGAVRVELSSDNRNGVPLNFGSRPNGLMSSYAGGINFNRELNKKTEINSSYFYNHIDHRTSEDLFRENFFQSGKLNYTQKGVQDNSNDNHRWNMTMDHKIDSMNSLKLTSLFAYNETSSDEASTGNLTNSSDDVLNASDRKVWNEGLSVRMNASLLWRHRFAKKGRTFSSNLRFSGSQNDRTSSQDSYLSDGLDERHFLQDGKQETDNTGISAGFSYTEPLGKRKYLEGTYSYSVNNNSFSREVFDVLENAPIRNDSISAAYSSRYEYHRAGLNFKLNRKNYQLTTGMSVQEATLKGLLEVNDIRIEKSFRNLLPTVRFNYQFSNNRELDIDYETSVNEPSIQQLQPVVDNSDPLNLYVGNPELRPSYSHLVRTNFRTFNPLSFVSFFAFIEAEYNTNDITVSQSVDEHGVRLAKPVNVDYRKSLLGNVSFSFPLEKLKSNVALSTNLRIQEGLTVIDKAENKTMENSIGGRIRYDLRLKDNFDVGLMANVSRHSSSFGLSSGMDQLFYNNSCTADMNITFLKKFALNSALEYLTYSNRSNGFDQTMTLLNISLSRFVMKGNSGEVKISVNNLLDQNLGITQTSGLNFIERRETNALGRYVMMSFTYSLNKQLNPLSMRPRGRTMRIMR